MPKASYLTRPMKEPGYESTRLFTVEKYDERERQVIDADIGEVDAEARAHGVMHNGKFHCPKPADDAQDITQEISDTLLEHIRINPEPLILALREIVERHSIRLASDRMHERLKDNPQYRSLLAVFVGKAESARAEATRRGVSHSTVLRERRKGKVFQNVPKIQ
jgi:hypothetical protein